MKKITITLFLICFVTASAYAIIFGETNFGWTGYPDHECRKSALLSRSFGGTKGGINYIY